MKGHTLHKLINWANFWFYNIVWMIVTGFATRENNLFIHFFHRNILSDLLCTYNYVLHNITLFSNGDLFPDKYFDLLHNFHWPWTVFSLNIFITTFPTSLNHVISIGNVHLRISFFRVFVFALRQIPHAFNSVCSFTNAFISSVLQNLFILSGFYMVFLYVGIIARFHFLKIKVSFNCCYCSLFDVWNTNVPTFFSHAIAFVLALRHAIVFVYFRFSVICHDKIQRLLFLSSFSFIFFFFRFIAFFNFI